MSEHFRISQRHYDIILKQAVDNLPQESGGFLGGKDRLIQAILPVFNQHMENKTDTYGVTSEDINRAHQFFAKHGLDYYGVYHTHPKGIAYPSKADINTGQKYHFIVGLQNPQNPIFAVYEIKALTPYPLPLEVLTNQQFNVLDIHNKSTYEPPTPGAPVVKRDPQSEVNLLSNLISNIKQEKPAYEKLSPLKWDSDFSTLA